MIQFSFSPTDQPSYISEYSYQYNYTHMHFFGLVLETGLDGIAYNSPVVPPTDHGAANFSLNDNLSSAQIISLKENPIQLQRYERFYETKPSDSAEIAVDDELFRFPIVINWPNGDNQKPHGSYKIEPPLAIDEALWSSRFADSTQPAATLFSAGGGEVNNFNTTFSMPRASIEHENHLYNILGNSQTRSNFSTESLVELKWFSIGKLSFIDNYQKNLFHPDIQQKNGTWIIPLNHNYQNIEIDDFYKKNKHSQYQAYHPYSFDKQNLQSFKKADLSKLDTNLYSAQIISALNQDLLKRKFTFIDHDNEVSIIIRDYELPNAEKLTLIRTIEDCFLKMRKNVSSILFNGVAYPTKRA